MSEAFDAFEFLAFVRGRWRTVAVACGVALLLAAGISLLLPKRYTATASIVIEPPGASDLRTATAVSPVYLESLRTYERFAASDTLFARAVQRFHLQSDVNPQPIEGLKRQVLKAAKLRDTKILEISVTLTDPRLAQQFVEYLANETVLLSRNETMVADREMVDDATKQVGEAQARLQKSRAAWNDSAAADSTAGLQSNIDANTDVLAKVRHELVIGDTDAIEKKRAAIEERLRELEKVIARDSATLAHRTAERQAMEMDLNAAQTAFDAASDHVRELRDNVGTRGERLRVIDPGIVPQRPSSPNVTLNVLSAFVFALIVCLVYLTLAFAIHKRARLQPSEVTARRAFSR